MSRYQIALLQIDITFANLIGYASSSSNFVI